MDALSGVRLDSVHRTLRRGHFRITGAILAAALVVGGCGSVNATPLGIGGSSPTALPAGSATPTDLPTPLTTPAPVATPSPTDAPGLAPSPSAKPTPGGTWTPGPDTFQMIMGKGVFVPTISAGSEAGSEVDDFGFDLLRRLDADGSVGAGGNVCASPTSIALALAMVREGARGATATEMDRVMHGFGRPGDSAQLVAMLSRLLDQNYYGDDEDPFATAAPGQTPSIELDISNQIFLQKGLTLEQSYLDALGQDFGAGVGVLDFASNPDVARQAINRWAGNRTHGRIPEVLHPGDVTDQTLIALANAIYLKAAWASPFDPTATKNLPFTRADGSKVSVPTMAIERSLAYSAGTGYRAVDLPYGGAETLSMTIIVPDDMTAFTRTLTSARLAAIDAAGRRDIVTLTLPRFSVESRFQLSSELEAMGMPTLFTDGADLSGVIAHPSIKIDKVVHQANIDVVEEGTTAAAVTVVIGKGTIGGGEATPRRVTFHVDRPFIYLIREASSGAILFMGRVGDPSARG
jgi:serpin B